MARNKGKRPGTTSGSSNQPGEKAKAAPQSAKPDTKPGTGAAPGVTSAQSTSSPQKATAAAAASTKSGPGVGAVAARSTSGSPIGASGATSAGSKPTGSGPMSRTDNKTGPSTAAAAAGSSGAPVSNSASVSNAASASNATGSFWPGLLGGLLGGAAMALAASLFWAGGGDTDAVATLQSTTADLDRRLTATEGQAGEVGALTERLAVIETAPALSGADGGGDVGDLVGRLDEVEQQFASLADAVDQATTAGAADGSSDMIAGLTDRLGAAEQELADLKLVIAEAAETGQAANDGIAAIQTAIPGIEAMLASTGSTVEENGRQAAALGLSVEALNQTTEQLGGDISTLSGRVGEAENQLAYMGGEYQRAAAMVVTIGDIDRAIAKAEPFEQALQSLAALGQDDAAISEALSTLQPMAADGVPTLAGLQSSFGETGSRILLAEDGNETLADKVSGNVFSIINMRPSGAEVEGDNSRAIVARAQAKLSGNDLEGTIAELGVLEGSAAESAGDWIAKASDRLAADAAIADLRAHAQSLLAKGS